MFLPLINMNTSLDCAVTVGNHVLGPGYRVSHILCGIDSSIYNLVWFYK